LLGSIITSVPGSSSYFLGGVVTYSNEAKEDLLRVQKDTMIKNGAVSEETATEMAANARKLFSSDVAVSVTGIAGPGGGTAAKPVGLVWIGLSTKNKTFAKGFNFEGDRDTVRMSAADTAVRLLIDIVADTH